MSDLPADPTAEDLAKARTALRAEQAKGNSIRLRVKRNQLIERNAARRIAAEILGGIRDDVLAVPSRQAALLAADFDLDPARLHVALQRILIELMDEIATTGHKHEPKSKQTA